MKALILLKSGERVLQRRTVDALWLRVGRNASCEIHLPDPRIALEQGMITDRDGPVYVEGEGSAAKGGTVTRKAVRSVRMKPGEPLEIGPYRVTSQPAPQGFDLAIAVELVKPLTAQGDLETRTSRRTLASVGMSKRGIAWGAIALILLLFLLLPAGRVLDMPWSDAAETLPVGDRAWNPGGLMLAHQPVEQKCAACHQKPFEMVRNEACLECHGNLRRHVPPASQAAGLFAQSRCTDCHTEHKGPKATHRDNDHACVDCHRDIQSRAKGSTSRNVSDFASDHPPFRLSFQSEGGKVVRLRMGEGTLREAANLKFPHDLHLDAKGIKSPGRGTVRLECTSCHVEDSTRRSFQPVSMARHCQECHRLEFEPAVTTREVPHGDAAAAATVIEEFYANLALKGTPDSFEKAFGVKGEGLLRRAGRAAEPERQAALAMASRKAAHVTAEMMEVRACGACHEVQQPQPGRWEVPPVRKQHPWMPLSRFDHKTHGHAKCGDCHASAKSKDAADVSMPSIDKCRDCHAGSRHAEKKLTSNCLLCHGFHDAPHPWKEVHAVRR